MKLENMAVIGQGLLYVKDRLPTNKAVGSNLLKTFQTANMQVAQKVISLKSRRFSAKFLAQQQAKTLADISAKIYANVLKQPFTPTGNKPFLAVKSFYRIPQKKKDSVQAVLIWTQQGIKKNGYEINYIRLAHSLQSTAGGWDLMFIRLTYGVQPFGSMPNRSNSFRPRVLSQLAKLMFDSFAAASNCFFNSGVMRIWNGGAFPVPLGCLSRLMVVDMCTPINVMLFSIGVHNSMCVPIKTMPRSASTLTGASNHHR